MESLTASAENELLVQKGLPEDLVAGERPEREMKSLYLRMLEMREGLSEKIALTRERPRET